MKKLMIAASAALCATVGFSDVTSANIVGYQNQATREYYSIQVPNFDTVGSEGLSIQAIVPQAPEEGMGVGGSCFDIQTLDEDGCGGEEVFYYMTVADDYGCKKDGWYEEDGETFATREFDRAEGFIINNSIGAETGVQYAGQVNLAETDVPVREAYSIQGNLRPVAISIQDITPISPEEGMGVGGSCFDIQTLDEDGCGGEEVFYYMTVADDYGCKKDGWYEEDGETFATREFAPGEGFIINNSIGAEATIRYAAK